MDLSCRSRAPAENEFGALKSCEKATGGNHFQYSEVHVLQLSLIESTVTASVRRPRRNEGPAFPLHPPLYSAAVRRRFPLSGLQLNAGKSEVVFLQDTAAQLRSVAAITGVDEARERSQRNSSHSSTLTHGII